MSTIEVPLKPRRNEDYVWRQLDESVLVLGDEGRTLRMFNATAALVWKLCDGSRTVEEIAAAVGEAFDGSVEAVHRDTRELIEHLREMRMLT